MELFGVVGVGIACTIREKMSCQLWFAVNGIEDSEGGESCTPRVPASIAMQTAKM